ncbi:MAG: phosphoribosyl-AMP cyclohydrolase [Bacteroidota bacterium]|jgi:phosphoribosyl-AMP cyclohydrolase
MKALLDAVKFDSGGLLTAVVQDAETGEVLMVSFMNKESLERTIETGKATYWSRSRKKLWVKGEESGHVQTVHSIHLDCDGDAILLKVHQAGGACHTGHRSCFYREVTNHGDGFREKQDLVFNPDDVYHRGREE